jgi:hypothetical protein
VLPTRSTRTARAPASAPHLFGIPIIINLPAALVVLLITLCW